MIEASCLCGSVSWSTPGPVQVMSHCHCARCRKTHGSLFATYAAAPADSFRRSGTEHIVRWESSPEFFRCFCRHCGSVVPGDQWEQFVFVPAGNFNQDPEARPFAHIFVASKAPWYEIHDSLPQFEAYPAGVETPVVGDRPPVDPPGGVRGSCLCGGIAFVIEAPPLRAYHCHCQRCRKARSAAHASNLAVAKEGVRFTRGAELIRSYKVPEAERFAQAFCRTCGSAVARVSDNPLAVIPLGSLDDDPGIRPQGHIFVGSKAPWYEITDDLPQYEAYPTA